jgi:uncharacterized membrane protein
MVIETEHPRCPYDISYMTHSAFLFLHLLGVVLLLGNITVTSAWKVYADRTEELAIVAFAQRLVIYTDVAFTAWGAGLVMLGGYGMLWTAGIGPWSTPWLVWSQVAFFVSGAIWLAVLIPLQIKQLRLARSALLAGHADPQFARLRRRWLGWGLIATVPLVAAMWLMVSK